MTGGVQFTVPAGAEDGFYVAVAEAVTVYETYSDAVNEIQEKLDGDKECLLAEVAIDAEDGGDDVAVTLEQVGWQQVIRDLAALDGGETR